MIILYHKRFIKRFKKLNPRDRSHLSNVVELFAGNPYKETLRNHALHGKYASYRSIDIKGDLLALYTEDAPDTVRFCYLGTHHELYGS